MASEAHHSALKARIENWARYVRQSETNKGHCYSIEHRYRSPQWGHWDSAPPEIRGEIDILDAHTIEDALKQLDGKQRRLVKLHYVYRFNEKRVAHKLRIQQTEFDELHDSCLEGLEVAIKRLENSHDRKKLMANIYENLKLAATGHSAQLGRFCL